MTKPLAVISCVVVALIASTISGQNQASATDIQKLRDGTFKKEMQEIVRINETYGDAFSMGKSVRPVNEWINTMAQINYISRNYENFARNLASNDSNWNCRRWSEEILWSKGQTNLALNSMYRYAVDKKLFDKMKKEYRKWQIDQSEIEILHNIYKAIDLAQFKGYIMTMFAMQYMNIPNRLTIANIHKSRAKQILRVAQNAMKFSKLEAKRSDPIHHMPNKTYVEVTKLLQGVILNEENIATDTSFCAETCEDTEYLETGKIKCTKKDLCSKQGPRLCMGQLHDCKTLPSNKLSACFTGSNKYRKIEYIDYKQSRMPSQEKSCRLRPTLVNSYQSLYECSYCMCICDEETNSERYVNMRQAMSDFRNNKVVTGLRFVKSNNRMIHMQIQEGTLIEKGQINQDTVAWRPIENFSIRDKKRYKNQDYFVLTYHRRAVDLDDIFVPTTKDTKHGWLITGVRFKRIGEHLNFEIHTTKYNYNSGKLVTNTGHWLSNDNTRYSESPRTEHILGEPPQLPTKSAEPSKVLSKHNTFVKFTHTSVEFDAAQTTVPFLDAQPVTSAIAKPLCGAGIYYKGQRGYGGFLAPKIMNCNLNLNLDTLLNM